MRIKMKRVLKQLMKKIIPITKYSSLNTELFSLSCISEYKYILCELIPSPETSNEVICCGVLYCNDCLKKIVLKKEEIKEYKICKLRYEI